VLLNLFNNNNNNNIQNAATGTWVLVVGSGVQWMGYCSTVDNHAPSSEVIRGSVDNVTEWYAADLISPAAGTHTSL